MWVLLTAVASASLLGSMHCVGMCGPLAIWASGAGERVQHRHIFVATALYHFGRMLTYVLAGLAAGLLGGLVDVGGELLGLQMVAAKLVGTLMILFGAMRLWSLVSSGKKLVSQSVPVGLNPSMLNRLILALRPYVLRLPLAGRGLAAGLLTALLPCGWLYLFALVAAGTGSALTGPLVMLAFWLGTVPALVGLVVGTQTLALHLRNVIPAAAAVLLILGGCYTAAGRGFAQLNSLSDIRPQSPLVSPEFFTSGTTSGPGPGELNPDGNLELVAELSRIQKTPLPCCEPCNTALCETDGWARNNVTTGSVRPEPGFLTLPVPETSVLETSVLDTRLQDRAP